MGYMLLKSLVYQALLERAATILSALEAEETTIPISVHHEEVSEVHEETEQLSLFKKFQQKE